VSVSYRSTSSAPSFTDTTDSISMRCIVESIARNYFTVWLGPTLVFKCFSSSSTVVVHQKYYERFDLKLSWKIDLDISSIPSLICTGGGVKRGKYGLSFRPQSLLFALFRCIAIANFSVDERDVFDVLCLCVLLSYWRI